jgi:hypothetical protein
MPLTLDLRRAARRDTGINGTMRAIDAHGRRRLRRALRRSGDISRSRSTTMKRWARMGRVRARTGEGLLESLASLGHPQLARRWQEGGGDSRTDHL